MAKINAIGLSATSNADGYSLAGGTTARTLTVTGGDVSIVGSGAAVITYPTSTSTLATIGLSETLTSKTLTAPVLNSPTVGTSLLPTTSDAAALGSTTKQWSDLFLAEGAVINFDNGDITLTQTGNNLAIAGGFLTFGSADGSAYVDIRQATVSQQGLRIEGDVTAALGFSTYVTGDAQVRHTVLTDGSLLWGSGAAVADTNLYRSAANTLKTDDALIVTGDLTATANVVLLENAAILYDPAMSADGKYNGIVRVGTAGATLAFGDLVYLAVGNSRWLLADADALATAGNVMLAMAVSASTDGNPVTLLLQGVIRADAKFPTLTVGAAVYVGETAGAVQVAIPTGADNVIRVVGFAFTADELSFNPSQDHQTTVA